MTKMKLLSGPDLETKKGKMEYIARELHRPARQYMPRNWSPRAKFATLILGLLLMGDAGCVRFVHYQSVEDLPEEVDILNIDTRPQGVEVFLNNSFVGKTPTQLKVRFNVKRISNGEAAEDITGKLHNENILNTYILSEPTYYTIRLYTAGYVEREINHRSDGTSNSWNYLEILEVKHPPQPSIHQEQKIIIKP